MHTRPEGKCSYWLRPLFVTAVIIALNTAAFAADETPPTADTAPTPTVAAPPKKPSWPRKQIDNFIDRLQLGGRAGYSQIFQAKARAKFGSGGVSLRPSYYRLKPPLRYTVLKPDFSFDRRRHDSNRLLLLGIGASYRRNFNVAPPDPEHPENPKGYDKSKLGSYPYVGLRANLFAAKIRVPDDGIDTDFKLGAGATFFAGFQYKTRLHLEASVSAMTPVSGYNFSSLRAGVNYKF